MVVDVGWHAADPYNINEWAGFLAFDCCTSRASEKEWVFTQEDGTKRSRLVQPVSCFSNA